MKIPKDLEKQILATPGITVTAASGTGDASDEEAKPVLAQPAVALIGEVLVAVVPYSPRSESNLREWKNRSQRSKDARLAVSKTFGPFLNLLARFALPYHAGQTLRITFTRLYGSGNKRMDRSNLPASMKGVEDGLALMMGADDGDPRWRSQFEQAASEGGNGVRIEIEVVK